mmetsp:Transcript_97262/g.313536  ORF Transcript_97262/g.313536 Transcript_97262/m.313536 type:complete len:309 (+) Transcript_97262:819-1745(+)
MRFQSRVHPDHHASKDVSSWRNAHVKHPNKCHSPRGYAGVRFGMALRDTFCRCGGFALSIAIRLVKACGSEQPHEGHVAQIAQEATSDVLDQEHVQQRVATRMLGFQSVEQLQELNARPREHKVVQVKRRDTEQRANARRPEQEQHNAPHRGTTGHDTWYDHRNVSWAVVQASDIQGRHKTEHTSAQGAFQGDVDRPHVVGDTHHRRPIDSSCGLRVQRKNEADTPLDQYELPNLGVRCQREGVQKHLPPTPGPWRRRTLDIEALQHRIAAPVVLLHLIFLVQFRRTADDHVCLRKRSRRRSVLAQVP